MSVPQVQITQMLQDALVADGYDVNDYLKHFQGWKTDWNKEEYCFWFFGKDGYYKFPLRDGKMVMRHVHLPPEVDQDAKEYWDEQQDRKGKKTSNTALVYAGNEKLNSYLLIYVLFEPEAHDISEMLTDEDAELMNSMADQAVDYLDNKNIYL